MIGRAALCALCLTLASGGCGQASLIPPDQIQGDRIDAPLTVHTGSPAEGQEIFTARERGHCVLCHAINTLDTPFQGNVGPDLSDVGARLSQDQIRLRIVDASLVNPDTVMPPYYRITGLNQVSAEHEGKPVLKAEEIEDLVAYLTGLKG